MNPFTDQLGRQVALKDATGNVNAQMWDTAGNLVKEIHADGGTTTNAYDAFGNLVRVTDALGKSTVYIYGKRPAKSPSQLYRSWLKQ